MSYATVIDEPVKVWAFFDGDIWPIAVSWRRRFIKFSKVIFKNNKSLGRDRFLDLVCEGESANFELEFNLSSYCWTLKKIMPKE